MRPFVYGLGEDLESLGGAGLDQQALNFILWMQRNGRFGEMLVALGVERPWVDWEGFR